MISLHNLADLALLEEKPAKACSMLDRVYRELWEQSLTISTTIRGPAVLQIILPHLQLCRRELALFCQHFGPGSSSMLGKVNPVIPEAELRVLLDPARLAELGS